MSEVNNNQQGVSMSLTREDVLRYYRENIIDSLVLAQHFSGKFPVGVLNNIRDAMTHLSRTVDEKLTDEGDIQKELLRAKNHFERVSLDCAKLSFMAVAKEYEEAVSLLAKSEITVPIDIQQKATKIKNERAQLAIEEGKKAPLKNLENNIVDKLKLLTDDFDTLQYLLKEGSDGNVFRDAKMVKLELRKINLDSEYHELNNQGGLNPLAEKYFNLSTEFGNFIAEFHQEYNAVRLRQIEVTRIEAEEKQKKANFARNNIIFTVIFGLFCTVLGVVLSDKSTLMVFILALFFLIIGWYAQRIKKINSLIKGLENKAHDLLSGINKLHKK